MPANFPSDIWISTLDLANSSPSVNYRGDSYGILKRVPGLERLWFIFYSLSKQVRFYLLKSLHRFSSAYFNTMPTWTAHAKEWRGVKDVTPWFATFYDRIHWIDPLRMSVTPTLNRRTRCMFTICPKTSDWRRLMVCCGVHRVDFALIFQELSPSTGMKKTNSPVPLTNAGECDCIYHMDPPKIVHRP